ncbi:Armadillo/beta-catenin-like repeat family protein [Trichomonas vaginalis G3]|uniref:Armadillo/beta-catenin-like repeat family protein n=1 Tax=Trichomonas vaginalis (strain ATCC PRA-98 / G3) TaxID=412133 RepID=A2EL11_TRIV3|nr:armadillo repeat-containing protein 4 (armc4) family [Trichomonas vaginalis G3]EAY06639.1 Armadillo/beta-catenin-like repeat family protein [Trichomonas vaginalis G3]KAI5552902.1 armadillo repeat-containing protein 4 (armc4) family [Trichomonas vaginalis G3]|eukprot:XP_001318862.1 Armadillo/beta-catenin-like repeat family protein [Trichomonas vaginalis G3]
MEKFETELLQLKDISGIDKVIYPLNWIRWESEYKTSSGIRAPPWRQSEGDIGYILASTHDKGVVAILCKNDETCVQIKGYIVNADGEEELDYTPQGSPANTLTELLSGISEIFKEKAPTITKEEAENAAKFKAQEVHNDLDTLPTPVLVLTQPEDENDEEGDEEQEQEDDEPIVPFPKQTNSDEYSTIYPKMKNFTANTADPTNTDLQDLCNNPALKEQAGQRAVLMAGAISAMRDVLCMKQIREGNDTRRSAQIEAAIKIFAAISLSPMIRRHLANEDTVKIFMDILKRDEPRVMNDLFTTIANCCHNTKFRHIILRNKKDQGVDAFIVPIKKPEYASQVCYVLYSLNRSHEAARIMANCHLSNVLDTYTTKKALASISEDLMLNITRLMYSMAMYGKNEDRQITDRQITFFCTGLGKENAELCEWSARAFTIFQMNEEQTKQFCQNNQDQCQGPQKMTRLLDNTNEKVILSALETISVIGNVAMIRDELCKLGVLNKLATLWKSPQPEICKGALKVIGILTQNQQCLQWTVRQNMIPSLLEYLNSTDSDFVIYASKAIGACCNNPTNLKNLIQQNGVRKLWSLMKSPSPGVQAAATRALVPFLKSPESPSYVRTFVDGLDLLVGLLKSQEPEVQASACMAISEVAKDNENLGVMTDLGVVELLSRLLSTKLDVVRKPLADAIGFAANYGKNRRRFGEEGAVDPLVSYLRPPSSNLEVHAATAKALKALSEDQENSKRLSQAGVVDYLLKMVDSQDEELQMAAAVAIRNIRTNRQ